MLPANYLCDSEIRHKRGFKEGSRDFGERFPNFIYLGELVSCSLQKMFENYVF